MKREIKFRAWDKAKHRMLGVDQLAFGPNGELESIYSDGPDFSNDPDALMGEKPDLNDAELMQFTGMHDKNGQEIYEGDLFEHRFGYTVFDDVIHEEMGTEYGAVVLEDGQFGVKIPALGVYNLYGLLLRDGHLDDMPKDDLFVMKISGNIYENPELLEAEK